MPARPTPLRTRPLATLALTAALAGASALVGCSSSEVETATAHPSDEVLPLVGTGGLGFTVGSLPAGAMTPFGMVRPGPDTSTNGGAPDFSHCGGYWYEDTEVRGFSQLHAAGIGVPDYGVVMIMPAVDLPSGPISERDWRQTLDHRREHAEVGLYRLDLVPSGVRVELSATPHTAVYRLTYPAEKEASLVVDLGHSLNGETHMSQVTIDSSRREVAGWMDHQGQLGGAPGYRVHFLMRFDTDFHNTETFEGAERADASPGRLGTAVGAILHFGTGLAKPVNVQIALSFVDEHGALDNYAMEHTDLEGAVAAAKAGWDRTLGVVELEGGAPERRRRFYTALYDAHLMPTLLTDVTGKYRGLDREVHDASGFVYYSDLSLWDTFRTFHPLMTLLNPGAQRSFLRSIERMTLESGSIPKWPLATLEAGSMLGYHGETVLVDSWTKGLRDVDMGALYPKLRAAAFPGTDSPRHRDCIEPYVTLGYCPLEQSGGSVSRTLENAFDDFVLAELAAEVGTPEDAAALAARAHSWKNTFNAEGMAQGRSADGSFPAGFREDLFSEDFTEGNSRQWSVFVPHDVPGLAEHLGGTRLLDHLTALFEGAAAAEKTVLPDLYYWHGNEPDLHAAYMFAELGHPELTERWVRWILDARYANTPAGLDGNDDGGTLSSWYVFSALGLYPKVGEARYVLGAPLFPRATVRLEGGKTLTIRAEGWTEKALHVRRVTLNGAPVTPPFIAHADLVAGGELVFEVTE